MKKQNNVACYLTYIDFDETTTLTRKCRPIMPFQMKRGHFPLKVTLAMTINKAQGQTLQKVKLFLPDPVFFSRGTFDRDLYRVQSFSDIVLSISDIE